MHRLLLFIFLTSLSSLSAQSRWFVNQQNQASNPTGTSWVQAFSSLDTALSRAQNHDEIWIANGYYVPSLGQGRDKTYAVNKLLKIYGGFKGTEAVLTERDTNQYATVLSGEIGDTSLYDNLYTIMTLNSCDSTTVLDGLIFERGYAHSDTVNSNFSPAACGGAVYIKQQSGWLEPRVRRCVFRDNYADYGGAWFSYAPQSLGNYPIFEYCRFERDSARFGGSGYVEGGSSHELSFIDCKFIQNSSNNASAFYCVNQKSTALLRLENCLFYKNFGASNSGFYLRHMTPLDQFKSTIIGNVIDSNYVGPIGVNGGCLYFDDVFEPALPNCVSETRIYGNKFYRNKAFLLSPTFAGLNPTVFEVKDNIFSQNDSTSFLFFSNWPSKSNTRITNNVFEKCHIQFTSIDSLFLINNTLDSCDMVFSDCQDILVVNNSFLNNFNVILPSSPAIINSIFKNNIFHLDTPFTRLPFGFRDSTFTRFDYNLFNRTKGQLTLGWPPLDLGPNNLYVPNGQFFTDIQSGDLSLADCSPAINRGINEHLGAFDLLGKPRVQSCRVDIGAIEGKASVLDSIEAQPACDLDGEISATTTPNCQGLQFQWVRNGNQSGSLEYNLPSGQYAVTILDAGGCPIGSQNLTIPQLPRPTMALSSGPHQCGSNLGGSVTATALTGIGQLRTLWLNFGFDPSYFNLFPGTYTAYVSDSLCWSKDSIVVTTAGELTLLLEGDSPSCYGQMDGQLCVTALNGVAPIEYDWQGLGLNSCLSQIGAGQYGVIVADSFGCETTRMFTLNQPLPLVSGAQVVNATTSVSTDGTISLSQLNGGTPPYSILWSTGDTTSILNNLSIGTYTVTITDANNCIVVSSWIVEATIGSEDIYIDGKIKLYPTIASEFVTLELPQSILNSELVFDLIDVNGSVLLYKSISSHLSEFQLSGLPVGTYFWRLFDLYNLLDDGKIVIMRKD